MKGLLVGVTVAVLLMYIAHNGQQAYAQCIHHHTTNVCIELTK